MNFFLKQWVRLPNKLFIIETIFPISTKLLPCPTYWFFTKKPKTSPPVSNTTAPRTFLKLLKNFKVRVVRFTRSNNSKDDAHFAPTDCGLKRTACLSEFGGRSEEELFLYACKRKTPRRRRRRPFACALLLFLFFNLIETRLEEEDRCIGRRQGGPIRKADWFRFRLCMYMWVEGIVCVRL